METPTLVMNMAELNTNDNHDSNRDSDVMSRQKDGRSSPTPHSYRNSRVVSQFNRPPEPQTLIKAIKTREKGFSKLKVGASLINRKM